MKLADFSYYLPKELIAQYPLKQRDRARLLVIKRQENKIEHLTFKDITDYLEKGDLLVLNDTKVLPSRLQGRRLTGGKVEVLLMEKKEGSTFNVLIKPSRLKIQEEINFDGKDITGKITAKNEITFDTGDLDSIYRLGMMPLPPYIKRQPEEQDFTDYQTVYARKEGAIASPTAGLHFTRELLDKIASSGIGIAYITLHISYSTFRPVKTEDVTKHHMDKEYFSIGEDAVRMIEDTQRRGKRIIAVGTTSCRALETYALGRKGGFTDLFIYPGYKFKIVKCLLTNFHLPKTTLFMLTCAFATSGLIRKAYREAIENKYRFYSYGDAMLII